MNLLDNFLNYRKRNGYSLILIRFEEGTDLFNIDFSELGDVYWQVPHVQVIGIEVKEINKTIIEDKITELKNYVFHREVDCFHGQSYMDVYPGVEYRSAKEQLIDRLNTVMPRINQFNERRR